MTDSRSSKSIVRRVAAASIGLVVCGLLFAVAGSLWFLYQQSASQYETRLNNQLDVLAGSLVQPLWSFDDRTIRTICDTYSAHADVVYVKVSAESAQDPVCEVSEAASAGVVKKRRVIRYQGRVIGSVEIAMSKAAHQSTVISIIGFGVVSAALISALVFVGIRHLLSVFLQTPLQTLSRWAGEMAQGRYEAKAGDVREVELHDLAQRFQDMAEIISARELELRKLSMATEQSPVSVVITAPHGRVEYVNQTFERVTGYAAEDVIGEEWGLVSRQDLAPEHYDELWRTLAEGGTWQGECSSRTRDGRQIWERVRIASITGEQGGIAHYVAVKADITLQKEQQQRIRHQAYFDSLTDLPNRFLCMDRLSQYIRDARRTGLYLAVLFLDLDDFKKVNDTLGHEAGDQLLGEAGRRVSAVIREADTVGRLGGDEFLVLAGHLNEPAEAGTLAEHLIAELRKPFSVGARELILTVSIGIACYPDDGDSTAELLRSADTAMYHSKAQGRNTFHYFTEAMNRSVARRLNLEEHLQGALERGELSLVYQPIVSLGDGRWIGAEALLRWHSPVLGPVSPAEFIPVAEHNGLILPIGLWVLEEAVALAAKWSGMSARPFTVSVNLSPRQLRDPHLVENLQAALEASGVPGQSLLLEITEGVLISGHADTRQRLLDLRRLGVGIAMDDFGTGYSSLSYLRTYPFTALKIDRSFIDDLTTDATDRELVHAAVHMGNALGMTVVAEGVENEAQRKILAGQGCERAQGFHFGQPVPGDELTRQIAEWTGTC